MTGTGIPSPDTLLAVARDAAEAAGAVLAEGWSAPKHIEFKGEINLVTQYDLASEKIIVDHIRSAFPDHEIVTEETGRTGPSSSCRWYVDPLDGTTNFAHGFPVFCVSIAFEALGPAGPEIMVGVVHDPLRREIFTAIKGRGAQLNGHRLTVSRETDPNRALVATGFPYDIHRNAAPVLARLARMIVAVQGLRRAGAAALDLAWLAAGRLDGFWEQGLSPWDTAAGMLLVQEAGGTVTDFSGRPYHPVFKEILATNSGLHYNLCRILSAEPGGLG